MTTDQVSSLLAIAPLVAIVATMPLYRMRRRGRPLDPDVARRSTSALFGYFVRDWAVWVLAPIEQRLVRHNVSPTALNLTGLGFGIASGLAFAAGWLAVGGWCVALGGICDILDGRVARARGMASARGAFLDSTLDRFAEAASFTGIAWYFAGWPWAVAATIVALAASMLVSYARARGEALGVVCTGGLAQRAERMVMLAFAGVLDPVASASIGWLPGRLLVLSVALIGVAATFTAVSRTMFIARELAQRPLDPPGRSPQ